MPKLINEAVKEVVLAVISISRKAPNMNVPHQ